MANAHSPVPDDRIPVIVGVGEIADHPAELTAGLEPLALLEAAVKRAAEDSDAPMLSEIDSLDVVNFLSWRYRDPEQQLAAKLGIKPPHCFYGPVGGESPIRYLHEAAQRIARGETKVAVVCGAEAQSTATKAERAKIDLLDRLGRPAQPRADWKRVGAAVEVLDDPVAGRLRRVAVHEMRGPERHPVAAGRKRTRQLMVVWARIARRIDQRNVQGSDV